MKYILTKVLLMQPDNLIVELRNIIRFIYVLSGLIYDDELELCDLVWAHTTASFILAFAGPGTPKEVLSSEVCPQHNIETVDKIEVYASGTTLRLSED